MKRSRSLVLTTMMASGSLSLAACDGPSDIGGRQVDALSYASVAECAAASVISTDQCETAFRQAQQANTENAPRFDNRQSCEEQYGVEQCVPRNNGSFFTPLLTGFIVGQALNNFGGGYRGAPMYRNRFGEYVGGAGGRMTRDYVTGRTRIAEGAFDPAARAPTRVQSRSSVISRGGFGGGGGRSFGG